MTRSELCRQVAGRTGTPLEEADAAVRAALAAVAEALARGETVGLAGFGTFGVRARPAHTARNPRTGARIAVPASRSVSFRASRGLRDVVNRETG